MSLVAALALSMLSVPPAHSIAATAHSQQRQRKRPAPTRRQPRPARGDSVYYPNCDAVRAAGAAPIRRGEPGYRPPLDRDDDGIACEPWRGRR